MTLTATTKVCSTCRAEVARQDCHKNRFGEYICSNCQAAGVKASRFRIMRHVSKKLLRKVLWALSGAGLFVVIVWMFVKFMARLDS